MFAVLDVETTGLRPARDRIIEIAIVRVDAEGNLIDEWCTLVNAGRRLGATEIHRITRREVADAPSFNQVVGDVLSRLGDHVVVAHNARFDSAMVDAELRRAGHEVRIDWLCTLQLVKRTGFDTQRSLRRCCESLGVCHDDGHDALVDSRAAANLLGFLLAAAHERGLHIDLPDPLCREGLPALAPYGATVHRAAAPVPAPPPRRLVDRAEAVVVPPEVDDEAARSYMDLLDRVLEDRLLTPDEVAALIELATSWGLALDDVRTLHGSYAEALAAVAMADGRLSGDEHRDLVRVADLLGVPRGLVVEQLQRFLP